MMNNKNTDANRAIINREENHETSDREELLKDYIRRLTSGDDLEHVRADFKENFSNVSAIEIAKADRKSVV